MLKRGLVVALFGLGVCGIAIAEEPYKAPVYELPPAAAANAEVHLIVVRHAYAECGDSQCDLTDDGYGQRERLRGIVSGLVEDGFTLVDVYASNTCRTTLTVTPVADDHDLWVNNYPAVPGVQDCGFLGDTEEMPRPTEDKRPANGFASGEWSVSSREEAIAAVKTFQGLNVTAEGKYLFITADHSNFVCKWMEAFEVPGEEYNQPGSCSEGNLEHTDFADIFWLYDAASGPDQDWHVVILENGFDIDKMNEFEKEH